MNLISDAGIEELTGELKQKGTIHLYLFESVKCTMSYCNR